MPRLTNEEVVEQFLSNPNSYYEHSQSSLMIGGGKLWSYGTVIMEYRDDYWLFNPNRYSSTTSKHQSLVHQRVNKTDLQRVTCGGNPVYSVTVHIPRGASGLLAYTIGGHYLSTWRAMLSTSRPYREVSRTPIIPIDQQIIYD